MDATIAWTTAGFNVPDGRGMIGVFSGKGRIRQHKFGSKENTGNVGAIVSGSGSGGTGGRTGIGMHAIMKPLPILMGALPRRRQSRSQP